ncbi:TetR/AcrR family transcriptional regulator [Leisingera sp. MMG026]|uniref:TetR/AcrR family transcriptional regulator n=1 Tax=Leisingera sp. MMG026 TaxID=2909982 RepID=UPI001F26C7DE|nr:TetR/AcrR family transcriptional regulator [Leisingera sp. MMG026]MCF6433680.1 TetR/AcrR family transcriptional regulator [Leisingera sp. MMG026]
MGRHKEFDPDDAVEAALKVFWRKGYHDASLQDLIAGTGVNSYGLYSVFGSKHGLYLAAFERYNRDVTAPLARGIARAGASPEGLRRALQGARARLTPGGEPLGCFVCNSMVEMSATDEKAAELAARNRQMLSQGFARFLQRSAPEDTEPARRAKAGLLANGMYTLGLLIRSRSPEPLILDHLSGLCALNHPAAHRQAGSSLHLND